MIDSMVLLTLIGNLLVKKKIKNSKESLLLRGKTEWGKNEKS